MASPIAEFASGAIFGGALLLSGVYVPQIIKAQMLFTDLHMLTVFMGASASSAIVLDLADRTGLSHKTHRPPVSLALFPYDGNIVGGALVGLGMALSGACPGTGLVQVGAGMVNGALVVLGGILGAMTFLQVRPLILCDGNGRAPQSPTSDSATVTTIPPTVHRQPAPKSLDMPTALSIQPLTMLLLWIPMCLAVIALAQSINHSLVDISVVGIVPPAYGGVLIGVAQATTVLFTRHHIGASAGYEDFARWILQKLNQTSGKTSPSSLITPSTTFSAGIICSVATLNLALSARLPPVEPFVMNIPSAMRAIAAGASMIFGARLAGGCTSGHGISGLSKFSLASLATTAAIFGGGILSAQLLGA